MGNHFQEVEAMRKTIWDFLSHIGPKKIKKAHADEFAEKRKKGLQKMRIGVRNKYRSKRKP